MQLGHYNILRNLSDKCFLAHDSSGRKIVLKLLPPDCLLEGQINPNIAERLRRVREIAMTDVANLRGVERDGDRAFLVWDFVEGVPFDTFAASQPPQEIPKLVRELVHTVEHFHSTGLVHGALHSGNVLVDSAGRIHLIDVSPLLFLDPKRDEQAIKDLCQNLNHVHEGGLPIGPSRQSKIRRRTLFAALLVIALGTAVGITIHRAVGRNQPVLPTPPKLQK